MGALIISEDAIDSFKEDGASRNDIFSLIDDASNEFISTIQEFVDYVVSYVENDFAKCGPLKYTYDLVDNSLCYRIIQPFNGLWTGLGLYLILMFPILIMSCALEPLFRRYNKPAYTKDRHVEMADLNPHYNSPPTNVIVVQAQQQPRNTNSSR